MTSDPSPKDTLLPIAPSTLISLSPYLPGAPHTASNRPFTTLTYATSLDSHISLGPSIQIHLSGSESKSLTHFLRSKHKGILIGVGTAVCDDPGLNCRYPLENSEAQQQQHPRPIILDSSLRWDVSSSSRVMRTAREGKGLAPWVVVKAGLDFSAEGGELEKKLRVIREHGGKVLEVSSASEGGAWNWKSLLGVLYAEGITSLMIEGGAKVINGLLESKEDLEHVDSVIVTIAPVYLGKGGVNVSPDIHKGSGGGGQRDMSSAVQFKDVKWCVLGNDVVMAARPEI